MAALHVTDSQRTAGAVRAELARRNILRRDAVTALIDGTALLTGDSGLRRSAAYERIAGTVPFSTGELEILSTAFGIPIGVLNGTRAPDTAAVGVSASESAIAVGASV